MREACAEQRMLLKDSNRFVHVAFRVEQANNVGIAPQTGFTRQRLKHRRVVGVWKVIETAPASISASLSSSA